MFDTYGRQSIEGFSRFPFLSRFLFPIPFPKIAVAPFIYISCISVSTLKDDAKLLDMSVSLDVLDFPPNKRPNSACWSFLKRLMVKRPTSVCSVKEILEAKYLSRQNERTYTTAWKVGWDGWQCMHGFKWISKRGFWTKMRETPHQFVRKTFNIND